MKPTYIKKEITVTHDIYPHEVARLFCDLDSDGQAEFFNYVATISNKWKNHFCFQMQHLTDSKILTKEGRAIMEQIGNYSERRL